MRRLERGVNGVGVEGEQDEGENEEEEGMMAMRVGVERLD